MNAKETEPSHLPDTSYRVCVVISCGTNRYALLMAVTMINIWLRRHPSGTRGQVA